MGNGQSKRFNQTPPRMLRTLEQYQKSDWKANIPTLVHAYNATFHGSTGYSPHFLMFGRHIRLAIDAFLGLTPNALSAPSQTEYVRKLRERLHFAYKKAQKAAKQSAAKHKRYYDRKARSSGSFHQGDRVLVRIVGLRGKKKLADKWEQHPYIDASQPNAEILVYEVKPESSKVRRTRTLHRNLLLPFTAIPGERNSHAKDWGIQSAGTVAQVANDSNEKSVGLGSSPISQTSDEDRTVDLGNGLEIDQPAEVYVIPQRRKPGSPGLRNRRKSDPSDKEMQLTAKQPRARKGSVSNDWVLS